MAAVFLEEKKGEGVTALKRQLTRLKNKRVRMLERGEERGLKALEKQINSVRQQLGRTNERKEIIKSELKDIEYLRKYHTLDEYNALKNAQVSVYYAWGVDMTTLKNWAKGEEMKMVKIEEQAATIAELEAKNVQLQEMLHGYESHANGLQTALDATEQQLQVRTTDLIEAQKELTACRKQFIEVSAKERTLSTLARRQEEEIKQFMAELDEYATLIGEKERQYDVLKQVAKPLLEQLVESL